MDAIFIQALANRAKTEVDLLDKLPDDVKVLVQKKMEEDADSST